MKDYPRVTEIIRVLKGPLDEPFFQTHKGQAILENKRAHGILVHALIENHIKNEWDEESYLCQPEDVKSAFQNWKTWADASVEKWLFAETHIVSDKFGYQGTPDSGFVLKGDKLPTLGDWKTADTIHEPSVRMQTAAYVQGCVEQGMFDNLVQRMVVQIGEKIHTRIFPKSDFANDFTHFCYCLNLKKFMKE